MSDKQETERPSVPATEPGSLTNDLSTDTEDVATLKQRLGRARERLAFYESFDRIIQENIRRSSELMIEATGLHEQAKRAVAEQARTQAALRDQQDRERARYDALLGDLQAELDRARGSLDAIAARVTAALGASGNQPPGEPADALAAGDKTSPATQTDRTAPDNGAERAANVAERQPASGGAEYPRPKPQTEPETTATTGMVAAASANPEPLAPAEPQLVEVLVHGVPTARVAISLQNHLRGLDQVSNVEAREFVEGLLRLQVTSAGAIDAASLDGWSDGEDAAVIRALPDLLEVTLPGVTER